MAVAGPTLPEPFDDDRRGRRADRQTPAGTTSWSQVLAPHVGDRWRLARLTVNYRTPAEIMAATADVLAAIDPGQEPPRSVRETGVPPWRLATAPDALAATLADLAAKEAATLREGRLAVIVPESRIGELGAAVARTVHGHLVRREPRPDRRLSCCWASARPRGWSSTRS